MEVMVPFPLLAMFTAETMAASLEGLISFLFAFSPGACAFGETANLLVIRIIKLPNITTIIKMKNTVHIPVTINFKATAIFV